MIQIQVLPQRCIRGTYQISVSSSVRPTVGSKVVDICFGRVVTCYRIWKCCYAVPIYLLGHLDFIFPLVSYLSLCPGIEDIAKIKC